MQRSLDGVGEGGRLVLGEREAVATRIGVDVAHRIREPANRANDRDRAVAERDQLAETAGLESRRHEEQVRARVDALGERRIEPEGEREPVFHLLRELAPALLIRRISCTEDDELGALLEEPR